MSFVTPQLRRVIEMGYDVGLKNYPIFSESHREELNTKILNHFRYREIGYETIHMFIFHLNRKMDEIMPFYNQLYESEKIEIDAITNYSYEELAEKSGEDTLEHLGTDTLEHSGKDTTENGGTNVNTTSGADKQIFEDVKTKTTYGSKDTEESTNTNKLDHGQTITTSNTKESKNVHSDTPQGMLSANFPESANYASDANVGKDVESGTTKNSGTDTSTTTIKGEKGKSGADESTQSGTIVNEKGVTSTDEFNSTLAQNYDSKNKSIYDSSNKQIYGNKLNITKKGYQGVTPSELLQKYRDTFLNIDLLVIDELEELFLQIY